jgi:hypothetical protein
VTNVIKGNLLNMTDYDYDANFDDVEILKYLLRKYLEMKINYGCHVSHFFCNYSHKNKKGYNII